MTDYQTFESSTGLHAYEIGTDKGRFFILANNRTQAAAKIRRDGYIIRDVNMVG
jgi:hypothetical protein